MQEKSLHPLLRLLIEIGPLGAYFWAFNRFEDSPLSLFGAEYFGIVAAMIVFIPLLLLGIAVSLILTRSISPIHIFSLVMVVILGGLTVYFNNETFTKLRPTIVNLLFAAILFADAFFLKKHLLSRLLGQSMNLTEQGWRIFTIGFASNFLAQGLINEFVRNFLSDRAFVLWDSFGQLAVSMVFMFGIIYMIRDEFIHDDEEKAQ